MADNFCGFCGTRLLPNAVICPNCQAAVGEKKQAEKPQENPYSPYQYNYPQMPPQNDKALPIKTTVLYLILNSIPVFGIIFMLFVAFDNNPKYTVGHKNLAKAFIIMTCVSVAIVFALYLLIFILFLSI
ncbi:MAG: hypothetical protein RR754_06595 [Oscillospiraceae bacterium]